jgi:hypothetical protein
LRLLVRAGRLAGARFAARRVLATLARRAMLRFAFDLAFAFGLALAFGAAFAFALAFTLALAFDFTLFVFGSTPRSWSTMAGFSRVETSSVISSPRAMARSSRRMIFPERVFGSTSVKRISSGLAMAPTCSPTQARSSSTSFAASAPGFAPRHTT